MKIGRNAVYNAGQFRFGTKLFGQIQISSVKPRPKELERYAAEVCVGLVENKHVGCQYSFSNFDGDLIGAHCWRQGGRECRPASISVRGRS